MGAEQHRKLIIIGGGPAGLSAAIYAARADLQPVVVTGMTMYGQASQTDTIENYPGFPQGIGGFQLGALMEEQARKFGAIFLYDIAESLDFSKRPFGVKTSSENYTADALILAMGASARKLGVEGEERLTGFGVSYCGTCDGAFFKDRNIHVIGGGDSALEEALFLTRFAKTVTVVHRRDAFRAAPVLVERARRHEKIRFVLDTVVKEIQGEQKVEGLLLENLRNGELEGVPSEGVFIFAGHKPNTELVRDSLVMTSLGTVQVDANLQSSVAGVFAAGEVADAHFKQLITSAGMGAAAAISATRYLQGE